MAEAVPALAPAAGWDAHVHVFDAAAPARGGHYTAATRPLAEIEAVAAAHGLGRLVLVQPSIYGTDHRVMLQALRQQPGRHRGVAVLDASAGDAELDDLHAAGVRGVRFNRVSPVGNGESDLPLLAPRLAERGWHVQWYVPAARLPSLVRLQRRTGLTFVLDHLGGLDAAEGHAPAHWQALAELAAQGAWLKLSGWYRLGCTEPYREMVPLIERAAALFGRRLVWGSDWPHTSLPASAESRHAALLEPVRLALGEAALRTILEVNPAGLYGPHGA